MNLCLKWICCSQSILYRLGLSSFDVYCAKHLEKFEHARKVTEAGRMDRPSGDNVFVEICPGRQEFIDPMKILHAASRLQSGLLQSCGLNDVHFDFAAIVEALMKDGVPDGGRSKKSRRVNLSAASSMNQPNGKPMPSGLEDFLKDNPNRENIQRMIGEWASFVWKCCNKMQDRAGQPGLGNRPEFSSILRK